MTTYTVRVWGVHSDPIVERKFRSKRAAEKFASEWQEKTYDDRHNIPETRDRYDWQGNWLGNPKPYMVSID